MPHFFHRLLVCALYSQTRALVFKPAQAKFVPWSRHKLFWADLQLNLVLIYEFSTADVTLSLLVCLIVATHNAPARKPAITSEG